MSGGRWHDCTYVLNCVTLGYLNRRKKKKTLQAIASIKSMIEETIVDELNRTNVINQLKSAQAERMKKIADAGGRKSTTLRSKQLIQEFLAASAVLTTKENCLKSIETQRIQSETLLEQVRNAMPSPANRLGSTSNVDSFNILYNMLPTINQVGETHEQEIEQMAHLNELGAILSQHEAERNKMANENAPDPSDLQESAFADYDDFQLEYDNKVERDADCMLLGVPNNAVVTNVDAPPSPSHVRDSSRPLLSIANVDPNGDLDTT